MAVKIGDRVFGNLIGTTKYRDPALQLQMAKASHVLLAMYPRWGGDTGDGEVIADTIEQIKMLNPHLKIGQYSIITELKETPAYDEVVAKVNNMNWWLRNAEGERVQWTPQYGAYDINFTDYTDEDAVWYRYSQYRAAWDTDNFFRGPRFDFLMSDNCMWKSRVSQADWKQDRTNLRSDTREMQRAWRRGMRDYWDYFKWLNPAIPIIGNTDNHLDHPEYIKRLDGAYLEKVIGVSWSPKTFDALFDWYLAVSENVIDPKQVVFNIQASVDDHNTVMYGLCTALLLDGMFCLTEVGKGYSTVPWLPEYEIEIGEPKAEYDNYGGLFIRQYEKATVIVNPVAKQGVLIKN